MHIERIHLPIYTQTLKMFGIWSRESKIKKRAKRSVAIARSILKSNISKISPDVGKLITEKISQTEKALEDGNLRDLTMETEGLEGVVEEHLSKFRKSRLRQNIESLLIAVALALFIRTFIVQPFKIPSGSMIPTLLVGDHLLVNKFIYGTRIPFTDKMVLPIHNINRGDVIVFTYPNYENDPSRDGIDYIKRVIGLPGDSIDIKGRNLNINEEEVPLKYQGEFHDERTGVGYDEYEEDLFGNKHQVIYLKGKGSTEKGEYIPVTKVPEGYVFVMGDNRDNSQDSRFWGFVPVKDIVGKAFLIHWSWDFGSEGILDKVRWHRVLSLIE
ncbi:MAG: signal peptidase I [Candidatus Dadabacteria bacterium CSP1-2]|jgi:signal peptidase I|nr:MAG: signal peptidase I [Candidatus Dadabacteria bacterium CSP1-2]